MQSKKYSERELVEGISLIFFLQKGRKTRPLAFPLHPSLTSKVFTPVEEIFARVDKSRQVPGTFWFPIN